MQQMIWLVQYYDAGVRSGTQGGCGHSLCLVLSLLQPASR
jgi:hypothetical protein